MLAPPRVTAPTEAEITTWLKQVQTRKWGKLLAKRSRRRFPQLVESFAARWRLPIEWMGGAPRHLIVDGSVDPEALARFLDADEALGLAQLTLDAPLAVYGAVLDHPRMAQVTSLLVGPASQPDLAGVLRKFRALRWLDVEVVAPMDRIDHKRIESLTLRLEAGLSVPAEARLPNLAWLLLLAKGPLRTADSAVELARQLAHLEALQLRNYDVRGLLPRVDVPWLVLDQCRFELPEVQAWRRPDHGGVFSLHVDLAAAPDPEAEPPEPEPPEPTPARFDRPVIPWVPRPDPKPLDADALTRWEVARGVRLPPLLRHHLTLDGGVHRWGDAIPLDDDVLTVFADSGLGRPYEAAWDHLDAYLDDRDDERAAWVARGCRPHRMVYLAMATHISAVLLDYSHSDTDPAVVVLQYSHATHAGAPVARFKSYAEFFAAIVERPTHDFLFMVALDGVDPAVARDWLDARRQDVRYTFGFEAYDGFALACANTRSDGLLWLEDVPPDATLVTLVLDRVDGWDAEDLLDAPTPDDLFDELVADIGGRWHKLYQSP